MFKLRKNSNILVALRDRELQVRPSAQKFSCNVLSQIIRWKSSTFRQVWKHVCRRPAFCEDGKIYLHDYTECLSLWGTYNTPYPLYRVKVHSKKKKIIDAVVCTQRAATSTINLDRPSTFRGAFVCLSEDNWLRSYDHETGNVIQEVYLGHQERICKFKHCDWETFPVQITLMKIFSRTSDNTRNRSYNENRLVDPKDDVSVIAVFTVFPLEFRAMMVIKNSVFGPKLFKVNVSEGTLVLGKGQSNNGEVCIYNFWDIMNHNVLYSVKLGETCSELGDGTVGSYPAGLPLNCVISKAPPMLFRVNCSDYYVKFGLVPIHYMINLPNSSVFQLKTLGDDQTPTNGMFYPSNISFERESVHFHYDETNRIIHEKPYDFVIYKYHRDSMSIEKLFSMNFSREVMHSEQEAKPGSRAHAMREARRRQSRAVDSEMYFPVGRSVMCMDYENELDLISVLGFNPRDESCEGVINIYDNASGAVVNSVDANLVVDDLLDYEIVFHLDTIVVLEGVRCPRYKCIVYKLCSDKYIPLLKRTACK